MQVSITRCSLCGDSGRISGLPHWQRIDPERGWDGVTMAVACSCDRGQTFRQQRYLTLASYELNVPHWRELLAQREEERAARMARLEEARATR